MSIFIISVIRTITPVIVGLIIASLAKLGLGVDADASTALTAGLDALFIAIYYAGARKLEDRWPIFGLLLGAKASVNYIDPNLGHDPKLWEDEVGSHDPELRPAD